MWILAKSRITSSVVEPEPDFFLLKLEQVKKLRLWAVAVWLRGSVVAKKRQFL